LPLRLLSGDYSSGQERGKPEARISPLAALPP
jgi:hypothetical protein